MRDSAFDYNAGSLSSYGYVLLDDNSNDHGLVSAQLGYSNSGYIIAKYRYVNNQKEYYLQTYDPNTNSYGTIFPNYSTSWGKNAMEILRQFQNQY